MMNNAAFHLSAAAGSAVQAPRHHSLLMLPSHSPPNPARLMSSSEAASFSMAIAANNANMAAAAGLSNSALNFSAHHRDLLHFSGLNPGFPYLNGFNGLPMMQMGFGLFPQHNFMSKSPGMVSPVTSGFFGPFTNNKDDDQSWQKHSPNSFPDSPRSGSRGSPMDSHLKRTKLPKGRSPPEQATCPLCKETVSGKSLHEHFTEELKTYRQEPINTRVVSSSSPDLYEYHNQLIQSCQTPSEKDSRFEIYTRVRSNRRTRCPGDNPSSSLPGENATTSRRSFASCSSESSKSTRTNAHSYAYSSKRAQRERSEPIQLEDAEVIVDVEEEDVTSHEEEPHLRRDSSPTEQSHELFTRSPLQNLYNHTDLPRKKRPVETSENPIGTKNKTGRFLESPVNSPKSGFSSN